jgi:hypothetical protein
MKVRFEYRKMTGGEFADLLKYCGLSRVEFAKIAGSQRRTIQEWVAGERSIPQWAVIMIEVFCMMPGAIEFARHETERRITSDRYQCFNLSQSAHTGDDE